MASFLRVLALISNLIIYDTTFRLIGRLITLENVGCEPNITCRVFEFISDVIHLLLCVKLAVVILAWLVVVKQMILTLILSTNLRLKTLCVFLLDKYLRIALLSQILEHVLLVYKFIYHALGAMHFTITLLDREALLQTLQTLQHLFITY